jgi:tetratricopeptide (TPR) repeat protein
MANGDFEGAVLQSRRARELQSNYALGYFMEGIALLHTGNVAEAQHALGRSLELALPEGTPSRAEVLAVLAVADSATDDPDAARARLDAIDCVADPYAAGLVYAALKDTDRALEHFGSVEEWGFTSTPHIRYFFPDLLGPIRQDPGFAPVLEQVDRSFGREPAS